MVLEDQPVISAVMPCLNEAATLRACIEKAFSGIRKTGLPGEVVIADNGSTDGSVELAESLGAHVVHQPVRGYGAALLAGVTGARGSYIVMADADDSYDWEAIPTFVGALERGADLVMGNRFLGGIEKGAMPPLHRYLGNPVLSFLTRFIYDIPIGDFHCGMRAFRRQSFMRMKLETPGMEFATEMVVRAARARMTIEEVPTRLFPDGRDRPPHLRSFRDGWRHLRFILMYAPNYLYLAPGSIAFVLGIGILSMLAQGPVHIGHLYLGIHFLALGCLLALLGSNVVCLGILGRLSVWMDYPVITDPLVTWLQRRYKLEIPLVAGAGAALLGIFVCGLLLWRYLTRSVPMVDSIHIAFIAATGIAVGMTVIFSAFLLQLLLQHSKKLARERQSLRPPPNA